MRWGSIATHSVLLVALLAAGWFLGQHATGEVADVDGVEVIAAAPGQVTAVSWVKGKTSVQIDSKTDAHGRWFVAEVKEPGVKPAGAAADAPEPAPVVHRFRAGAAVEALMEQLEPLRVPRVIASPTAEKLAEFGLASPTDTLTIHLGDRATRFSLGGTAFGSTDTYALDEAGRVVVLPARVIAPMTGSATRMRETRLYAAVRKDILTVSLAAGGRTLNLQQFDAGTPGKTFWARAGEKTGDDRYKDVVGKVLSMRALDFSGQSVGADWEAVLTVTVRTTEAGGAATSETGRLYRLPDGAFRVVSDHTRWAASVSDTLAKQLLEAIDGLFPAGN